VVFVINSIGEAAHQVDTDIADLGLLERFREPESGSLRRIEFAARDEARQISRSLRCSVSRWMPPKPSEEATNQ
jgi:hypothetical protein